MHSDCLGWVCVTGVWVIIKSGFDFCLNTWGCVLNIAITHAFGLFLHLAMSWISRVVILWLLLSKKCKKMPHEKYPRHKMFYGTKKYPLKSHSGKTYWRSFWTMGSAMASRLIWGWTSNSAPESKLLDTNFDSCAPSSWNWDRTYDSISQQKIIFLTDLAYPDAPGAP